MQPRARQLILEFWLQAAAVSGAMTPRAARDKSAARAAAVGHQVTAEAAVQAGLHILGLQLLQLAQVEVQLQPWAELVAMD
jgi:hypothetical protein